MEPNLNAYKPLLEYCACELPRYSASAFAFQFTVWTVMDFVILVEILIVILVSAVVLSENLLS